MQYPPGWLRNPWRATLAMRGLPAADLGITLPADTYGDSAIRITSKGQVTIPAEIREKAGLLPETEVEFVMRGDTVILRKTEKFGRRGKRLIGLMRGKGTKHLTTEEIMALTRR